MWNTPPGCTLSLGQSIIIKEMRTNGMQKNYLLGPVVKIQFQFHGNTYPVFLKGLPGSDFTSS